MKTENLEMMDENTELSTPVLTNPRVMNSESRNTIRANNFAFNNFENWRTTAPGVHDLLSYFNEESLPELNSVLFRFISEIRRRDGQHYPPLSLKGQLKALWRLCKNMGIRNENFNFSYEKNSAFSEFWANFDMFADHLSAMGVGIDKKQAQPVTEEMELDLWKAGYFGNATKKSIRNTVFFYICKFFGFRGKDEICLDLSWDCISFGKLDDFDTISYDFAKSSTHATIFQQKNEGRRPVVQVISKPILNAFLQYRTETIDLPRNGFFKKVDEDGMKFVEDPMSQNAIAAYTKDLMRKAGIEGFFTNHSIRRSACSQAGEAGVNDNEILERIGNKSAGCLSHYRGQDNNRVLRISRALDPFLDSDFSLVQNRNTLISPPTPEPAPISEPDGLAYERQLVMNGYERPSTSNNQEYVPIPPQNCPPQKRRIEITVPGDIEEIVIRKIGRNSPVTISL